MNKTVVIVLVLLVVLGGGYFQMGQKKVEAPMEDSNEVTEENSQVSNSTGVVDGEDQSIAVGEQTQTEAPSLKEFTVSGGNFAFTPNSMTVKKGDTVRVTFKNLEGFHDFKIDEFNVATKQIKGGSEETVEFVADKTGTFEYYCSVGQHRAMGMKGTLTITE